MEKDTLEDLAAVLKVETLCIHFFEELLNVEWCLESCVFSRNAKEEEMVKKEAEKKNKKRKRDRVCILCHTYILLPYVVLQ